MNADFWLERWQKSQIGFHQGQVNPHLEAYWSNLGLSSGAGVFVPLCGKSLDMLWLAGMGHSVIGIELSDIAARSFFDENNLIPSISSRYPFEVYQHAEIAIWCGNFFSLSKDDVNLVKAVYDRAALVALPPDMRKDYVLHLKEILPADVQILLVSFDYPQEQMDGPPFSVGKEEVDRLYGNDFEVKLLDSHDALVKNERFRKLGLTRMVENVFHISRINN
ncbi:thiopurine S-methyltransferase [Acidihalobacter prosperus]